MALEPLWKQSRILLVSDGGAPFDFKPDSGLLWRLQRYTSIVSRQASGVRKRWLISNFLAGELEGTYWGISSATGSYDGTEGYSKDLARDIVAKIRTDLDRFSDAEKSVLENHGYTLADAAVRKHAAHLIDGDPAETAIPNLHYMEEARVRSELADSHKLKLPFGRR
jgi:NTE family protein